MTDTNVQNLIINKLTKAQYEGIENPSDTELYLTPDESVTQDELTTALAGYATTSEVTTALDTKVNKSDIWYDSSSSTLYIGVAQS